MKKDKEISYFYIFAATVLWIITVAWMILIYRLSAENAELSTERSSFYLELIRKIDSKTILTEYALRKITHISEFGILALLSFLAMRFTNKISPKTAYSESRVKIIKSDNEMYIVLSLWLSLFYAVLDEYHQLFVPGRSGSIYDVAFDAIGIITVLLIIRIVFSLYLRRLGREEIRYE